MFDNASPHWPNPVNWTKSDDPALEPVFAQQIAKRSSARMAGDVVGSAPWYTIVGQALDVLRKQAKAAAEGWMAVKRSEGKRPARVVGVLLDGSGRPKFLAFRSADSAEEWFERATGDRSRFTYAAYYDTESPFAPLQLAEDVGGEGSYL